MIAIFVHFQHTLCSLHPVAFFAISNASNALPVCLYRSREEWIAQYWYKSIGSMHLWRHLFDTLRTKHRMLNKDINMFRKGNNWHWRSLAPADHSHLLFCHHICRVHWQEREFPAIHDDWRPHHTLQWSGIVILLLHRSVLAHHRPLLLWHLLLHFFTDEQMANAIFCNVTPQLANPS